MFVGCVVVGISLAAGAAAVAHDYGAWLAAPDLGPYQEELRRQQVGHLISALLTAAFGLIGAVVGIRRLRGQPIKPPASS